MTSQPVNDVPMCETAHSGERYTGSPEADKVGDRHSERHATNPLFYLRRNHGYEVKLCLLKRY